MKENESISLRPVQQESMSMTLKQVTDRVNMVHGILQKVMKDGTHYGKVPGCGARMVLFKPGADLLAMAKADWSSPGALAAAKRLMRQALAPHLGGRPLVSRELFMNLKEPARD